MMKVDEMAKCSIEAQNKDWGKATGFQAAGGATRQLVEWLPIEEVNVPFL